MVRNTLTSANFTRLVDDIVKYNLADAVNTAGKSEFQSNSLK